PHCCILHRPPAPSATAGRKAFTGAFLCVPARPQQVAGQPSRTDLSRGRAEKRCAEPPETPRLEPTAPAAAADCPAHADHVRTKLNKKRHVPQTQRAGDTAQEPAPPAVGDEARRRRAVPVIEEGAPVLERRIDQASLRPRPLP